ncbi:MAG TPA: hypothetical protein VHO90_08840 [Bacteroidales bacterium]|nr:hypothetical protein [Bacteroidales bacterium]
MRFPFSRVLFFALLFVSNVATFAQDPKELQKVFIDSFVSKLNKRDTSDTSLLLNAAELKKLMPRERAYFPLLLLDKINEDNNFEQPLRNYLWYCYYLKNNMVLMNYEDLNSMLRMDSLQLRSLQQKIEEKNDSVTNNFLQRYIEYKQYILNKKDTSWLNLLNCGVCDPEFVTMGNDIVEFLQLPTYYKRVTGSLVNRLLGRQNVKLQRIDYPEIYNEEGLTTSSPILTLISDEQKWMSIKIKIIFVDGKWKLYRRMELKENGSDSSVPEKNI